MSGAKNTAEVNYNNQKRCNSQDLLGIRNQDSLSNNHHKLTWSKAYIFLSLSQPTHLLRAQYFFVNLMNQTLRFKFTDQDHIQFSPIVFVLR